MELINKYRNAAYNGNFDLEFKWLNLREERSKIISFLSNIQKNNVVLQRISIKDIDSILNGDRLKGVDGELISKMVIQKANFNVSKGTKENGYTTRLLFLFKDTEGGTGWYLYGYAKGRYNSLKELNVKKGESLGCSFYISLFEKDNELSVGLSDLGKLKRLFINSGTQQ